MALLCHCHVVADRIIAAEIEAGAGSAAEVAEACGAGSTCGGCVPAIEDMLARMGALVDA